MKTVAWCIVDVLLLVATSCAMIHPSTARNDAHYALALVNFEESQVLIIAPDGSKASNLSARFPGLYTASWSPDGQRAAFVSDRSGNREIYSVDLETMMAVNLTQNPAADIAPSWSPDGQFIAFVSDRDYCPVDDLGLPDAGCVFWHGELYVMRYNGTDIRRVTRTATSECGAGWSPDSTRLFYSAPCSLVMDEPAEIYTVDLASGLVTQLTDSGAISTTPLAHSINPTPSPDGRHVLFYSSRDGDWELYLMDTDGGNVVRLTSMPGSELSASWSPDSVSIAWEHDQEILVMNVDTRNMISTGTKGLSACRPRWSPSGKEIAFVANCGIGGSGPHDAVYVMNRDGSGKINVTPNLGNQARLGLLGWVPIQWIEVGTPIEVAK